MIELQRRGLVKSIGVSRLHRIPMVGVPTLSPMLRYAEHRRNFGVQHLEALRDSGRQMPVVNQIVTGLQRLRTEFQQGCASPTWQEDFDNAMLGPSQNRGDAPNDLPRAEAGGGVTCANC